MSAMISEDAPAKVNLALHVTGQRADGYHLIETLVVFCEAGDRLTFEIAQRDRFTISGQFGDAIAADRDNLVIRARDMLRATIEATGLETPPVAIHLEKRVPVAAGIGGGSSDAAATLRGLGRLWGAKRATLRRLAPFLGADVPMCLDPRPLIARGIGADIEAIDAFPPLDLVLVNPGIAVSTPAVFAALSHRCNPPMEAVPPEFGDVKGYLLRQRNDLEAPARGLAPCVATVLTALEEAGAPFFRMSGSGATCVGLWRDPESASRAAAALHRRFPQWYVQRTRSFPAGDRLARDEPERDES